MDDRIPGDCPIAPPRPHSPRANLVRAVSGAALVGGLGAQLVSAAAPARRPATPNRP